MDKGHGPATGDLQECVALITPVLEEKWDSGCEVPCFCGAHERENANEIACGSEKQENANTLFFSNVSTYCISRTSRLLPEHKMTKHEHNK